MTELPSHFTFKETTSRSKCLKHSYFVTVADVGDLIDLRATKKQEAKKPTISLKAAKKELGL